VEHWWNDTDRGEWSIGGMILTGRQQCAEETCPSATLCTTNITQFGPESKPGFLMKDRRRLITSEITRPLKDRSVSKSYIRVQILPHTEQLHLHYKCQMVGSTYVNWSVFRITAV
jgi:hypothetical protein